MKKPSGFTLIEIIVAIVLSGVVALLAYGTLQAGFDSRDRLAQYRHETESVATLRAFLTDALRHPADAGEANRPTFRIAYGLSEAGMNDATLQFVSRGVSSPLGAGARWLIALSTDTGGLHLVAEPLDDTDLGSIESTVPSIRDFRVAVLADVANDTWRSDWPSERQAPAAVRIELIGSDGAVRGSPLVVKTSLDAALPQ